MNSKLNEKEYEIEFIEIEIEEDKINTLKEFKFF